MYCNRSLLPISSMVSIPAIHAKRSVLLSISVNYFIYGISRLRRRSLLTTSSMVSIPAIHAKISVLLSISVNNFIYVFYPGYGGDNECNWSLLTTLSMGEPPPESFEWDGVNCSSNVYAWTQLNKDDLQS